jgi:hypothetical protein
MLEFKGTDNERLQFGFRVAFARNPSEMESKILLQTLAERRVKYDANPEQATAVLSVGDTPMPTKNLGEHAAWATLGRVLLNLSEFITKG